VHKIFSKQHKPENDLKEEHGICAINSEGTLTGLHLLSYMMKLA
jgi:hypothetical protein